MRQTITKGYGIMQAEIALLNFIYQEAYLGETLTKNLLKLIMNKGNKITALVMQINEEYLQLINESFAELIKLTPEFQKVNFIKNIFKSLEMKFQVNKDNSDAHIAALLTKLSSCSEIETEKRIALFNVKCDNLSLELARKFYDFLSQMIVKLDEFL